MTKGLADQQQAMLGAFCETRSENACTAIAPHIGDTRHDWRRGVAAYRANAQALAHRALAAVYPVTARLLGTDNLTGLARQLWYAHPPSRGDIGQWGGELAALIDSIPGIAAAEPYLADVARVEWALHCASSAADVAADHESFRQLVDRDAAEVTLTVSPGTRCIETRFSVVGVIDAYYGGAASEEAAERLRYAAAETALIWRQGLAARVRIAAAGEPAFIAELQKPRSLLEALQAAPGLDFAQWLTPAVQAGLIVSVRNLL